ncbi:MAG: hypothetical protein HGB28_01420 [Oscillochloris sp.]|nr:hypothetical protein [Oscillochloris sp.]
MESRQEQLQKMAAEIERVGLRAPATMLLDLLAPLDVISSQIAQFARPLVRGTSLDPYAGLLAETANWQELRRLLSRQ